MPDKPISDLRSRMLADMAIRSFGNKTRHDYIRHVEALAAFLGRSPDTATPDDLRRFQQHQIEQGAQPSKVNSPASALRFLFTVTLGRPDLTHHLARAHYPRKLPRILSPDDVLHLLEAAPDPGLKYKAALSCAYGAGLRCGEVVMLATSAPAAAKEEALASDRLEQPCPCCGGRMRIIEVFERGSMPRYRARATAVIRIDTS